ncbi:Na+/H+ antiporter NhaC family protein [Sedimentibacter sp.]|uniref:Na+/H+ antiporter NhaC family protein n=1 Tax=Sedimentibacter sp. TaxID=1960295 RepID=UPI00289C7B0A|nr:Na+/H+ antiporter NhaC family protein [Sedimentibacter sp.]
MEYGILSLIPPILAITLAVITKNVILSLFISVLVGTTILAGGNVILGFLSLFQENIFEQIIGSSNAQTMVAMAIIGGFVGLIESSGGAEAFAKLMTRPINSRVKAQFIVWLGGLAIFFTDSGNSLILGPIFRPITDKLKISREKLAYLLDSTSAPISIMIPFAGWGVYIISLIQAEYEKLSIMENEFIAFIQVLPFQFYAITTLILIPIIVFSKKDFGPMAKAEFKAINNNSYDNNFDENKVKNKAKASTILIPLAALFITMLGILIYFGFPFQQIGGSKMRTALCSSYLLGSLIAMFMIVKHGVMSFKDSFNTWLTGMQKMMYILVVLVLAWSVGSVCSNLGTSTYIITKSQGLLTPILIPALLFVIGSIMSFATGTSWGTFAILMPIAIPMSYSFDVSIHVAIGAVLSGGLFGDHCSPISDTTILSSMASQCEHVSHVSTQIPYALVSASGSIIGYLIAAITGNYIALPAAIASMLVIYFICVRLWGVDVREMQVELKK